VNDEKAMIFSYKKMQVTPIDLKDLGTEER
jgi:hypothetical protein